MTQPYDVEFASQQYQEWLVALKETASLVTHNQSQAMMRAVMHRLRQCLAPEDVLAVANALPALPRGIFLEGWSLDEERFAPTSAEAFTAAVADDIKAHHVPPDTITADVFAVWAHHLDRHKAAIVSAHLPDVLKPFWPAATG